MSMRDKIASTISKNITLEDGVFVGGFFDAADAIIKALPDYDAQQARITELEVVLAIAESAMHEHDTACYEYDEENPWVMREWFDVSGREAIAKARLSVPPKNAALKEATK